MAGLGTGFDQPAKAWRLAAGQGPGASGAPAPGRHRTPGRGARHRAVSQTDWSEWVSRWGYIPVVVLFVVMSVIPLYIMVKISVSEPKDILTAHPPFWIHNFTLRHWKEILGAGGIWPPLKKSLIVATMTTVLAIAMAAPGAYVISRLRSRAKYAVIMLLFFTRMFPDVGIAVSIAVTFIRWNLLDTDIGLTLAHLIGILPLVTWILVGTYETIPRDLEKAALVDGCSRITALTRVVFPLALPGISVAAIFAWLTSWNEFTYALYLCLSKNTLPIQTYYYANRGNWFHSATYATVLTIPVFFITYFLQKYLKSGYLAGAVKG